MKQNNITENEERIAALAAHFGCDAADIDGIKAYKACVRTFERLVEIGICEDEMYDILNVEEYQIVVMA